MNEDIGKPFNKQVTFPITNVQVAPQGILIQYLMSPNASFTITLDENTVNDIVKQWVKTRQDIRANGQLSDMVRRNPHGNRLA